MRNWNWPRIAKIVTLVYCGICLTSVLLTVIGYWCGIKTVMRIGGIAFLAWFFNPIGALTNIITALITRKVKYLGYFAACTASWFVGIFLLALTVGQGV